jgi:predicted membrane-bound dolichyl-phosphate-mannose-protein mannosyltransferase
MITPALFHASMGSFSPLAAVWSERGTFASEIITNPLDVIIELFWLVVPIIFLIIVLYILGGRRTRWAGYDEAVKLTRR